ncbi:hypothetical protein HOV30_gp180 [Erwinia phage Derbicus]|uniref:Uncharacterized protein n=2 Tax=Derbicusvirus derbicus TaxID=2734104 RepID=A0A482II22_9CAUD|nr:hypothetical protein BIZ82_gp181 [Erwinia phage vB_EamM_EarlPhillipIV]YP_009821224.1 hypothetical protein HOV30_gp180 [Erwinia phage Derbicus]ANZ49030.1 hypothetical protein EARLPHILLIPIV_181 [Erwinia phage vB_EamM_EarlPhillipIV]QBP07606.1 hypothetical protein DERBICUS_180 [Erwinia phage Derbicus]
MEKEFVMQPVPFILRPPVEPEQTVLRYRTKTTIAGKDYLLYTPGPQDDTSELVEVKLDEC